MELFDLNVLAKLPVEEQIKIKKMTINTNELNTIPVAYLPDVSSTEYFFISYSHRDYRDVYNDIFDLQQAGLSIWYDRGIPAGNDWKEVATKYIAPFSCKGTIFYISENALISNSVQMEIKSALSYNKPFLVILISNKKESLKEMIERLYKENKIDKDKYTYYLDVFKEEVIYLFISDPGVTKVEKIKNSLPKQKTLSISDFGIIFVDEFNNRPNGYDLEITGLNDFYVTKIDMNDYLDLIDFKYLVNIGAYDKEQETTSTALLDFDNPAKTLSDIFCLRVKIGISAFANIQTLEYFEYPCFGRRSHPGFIFQYAFYRCKRLKEFKIIRNNSDRIPAINVGKGAFLYCTSLESFDFEKVGFEEESFSCTSLKELDLSKANCYLSSGEMIIPKKAFRLCYYVNKIVLPKGLVSIEDYAFAACCKVDSIEFPTHLKNIGERAFAYCSALKEIKINKEIERIKPDAFSCCSELRKIYFNGTRTRFLKVAPLNPFLFCPNDAVIIFKDGVSLPVKELYA